VVSRLGTIVRREGGHDSRRGGSLQLRLDLRALDNQVPRRVRVNSFRPGTNDVYLQLNWGDIRPL
jgi:hypothetical protein